MAAKPNEYWQMIRREPFILGYWRGGDVSGSTLAADSASRYELTGTFASTHTLGPPLIQKDNTAGSSAAGISIANTSVIDIQGLDLSLEAWIVPTSANQSALIIGKLNSANTFAGPFALRLASGEIQFAIGSGSAESTLTTSGFKPPVSIPSHIVATFFRQSVARIYLNGVNVAVSTLSMVGSDASQSLYVGGVGAPHAFAGLIGEAALYSDAVGNGFGALSATRVARHFTIGQQVYNRNYFGGLGPLS